MRRFAVVPVLGVVASAVLILAIVTLIAVNGPAGPQSAEGFLHPPTPPPAGVNVIVNTTSDLEDPLDGTCSLRAAIYATNTNGHAGNCDAFASLLGATDTITFNIGTGTPVIDIGSTGEPLPPITNKLTIDGSNSGNPVTISGNGLYQVFYAQADINISNLSIVKGVGHGGGGLHVTCCTRSAVSNVTFSDNAGGISGGAIEVGGVPLDVMNSTFSNNGATDGGAIYVEAGSDVLMY
jgi:CSLREA domain-containing protein